MTSKLVVNTIEADTGISSVSFGSSISLSSTSKFFFSDAGIDIGADTNINRPAAGVLGFNINSSEKARINSSGRLGLGTNNPDTTLTVQSGGDAQMSLKNSSGTTKAYVGTAGAFGSAGTDDLRIRSDSSNIVFGFSGAERLRIKSDGKVLIGSGATTSGLLNVKGNAVFDDGTNARITLQADGTSTNQILSTTTNFGSYTDMKYQAADHIFLYGGNELYRIRSNGKFVGGPLANGHSTARCAAGGLDLRAGQGGAGFPSIKIGADSATANATTLSNNTRKQARIGCASYHNSYDFATFLYFDSDTNTNELNIGGGTGHGYAATEISLWTAANNTTGTGTQRMLINSGGATFFPSSNVNINRGTSGAGYPLTVRGPSDGDAIRIERGGSYQWHIGNDTNGGNSNLYFKSNTTKEVVFPSTGGIAFNGDYSAANSLNDYEVGNWNSSVQWANGNTTGGYTNTTTVQGTYVKVGNVVHAWIQTYPNSYNSGSDCVIVGITLPFAVSTGGAVAFAPYSGRGNYGGWLANSTYPRTYANLNTGATKIVPLVTGNENGAGFWGHKSGTVAANASFTATYYSA